MNRFLYKGRIPPSKSLINRYLIVQSFLDKQAPDKVRQELAKLRARDIQVMKQALDFLWDESREYDCGEAGTVFRFLALRLSRIAGKHFLTGSKRLLARPQQDLLDLLEQLGVDAEMQDSKGLHLLVKQADWAGRKRDVLRVSSRVSSQFLSALLLSSWKLPEPLRVELSSQSVSASYLQMTLKLMDRFGGSIHKREEAYEVPAQMVPAPNPQFEEAILKEADASSAFSLAAFAALSGEAEIENFDVTGDMELQGDKIFPALFKEMGARIEIEGARLKIRSAANLRAVEWDLGSTPDLFPTLAGLCVFAEGSSTLFNAPHLQHKESNRIDGLSQLLELAQVPHEKRPDGMLIHGKGREAAKDWARLKNLRFDPRRDHRLAMAAALLKFAGLPLEIENQDVVEKSFPEFWSCVKA